MIGSLASCGDVSAMYECSGADNPRVPFLAKQPLLPTSSVNKPGTMKSKWKMLRTSCQTLVQGIPSRAPWWHCQRMLMRAQRWLPWQWP